MSSISICLACILFVLTSAAKKPNFIFILMDDQDLILDSPKYMDNLQSLIVNEGITLSNAFVSTPVCCPSRTENIVGRYFHNIGAPDGSCMHIDAIGNTFSSHSIYSVLHNNGYKTGIFGKLTNADATTFCNNDKYYKNVTKGAGMDRVYSMCSQGNFYCTKYFDKYVNGTYQFTDLNASDPSTYQSSQIANQSLKFIENMLESNQSFYNYIGFHTPHEAYVVAPWYTDYYQQLKKQNVIVPKSPNFNAQASEEMWWVNQQPALNEYSINWVNDIYIARIASTMQTDFYIGELVKLLNKYNELKNTYIIYSSDHGYKLGNHRIPCEKHFIYEEDIRVPFYMRGPNIESKSKTEYIISQIDIMPTVLDIVNITLPKNVDGKSFKKIIENPSNKNIKWRQYLLSEYMANPDRNFSICGTWFPKENDFHGQILKPSNTQNTSMTNMTLRVNWGYKENPGNTWRLLRFFNKTHDWTYAEYIDWNFTPKVENTPYLYVLFNNTKDPHQLQNIYDTLTNDTKNELHQLLMEYGACQGTNCP